jgi:23S rRNA-/tRNA-specific pseudouridylate synthase
LNSSIIKIYGTHILKSGDELIVDHSEDDFNFNRASDDTNRQYRLLNFTLSILNSLQNPPAKVLYEDDEVAVMFKPSGVHSLSWIGTAKKNYFAFNDCLPILLFPPYIRGIIDPNTIDDHIKIILQKRQPLPSPLPCHRLDARVSGCLVIAKTKLAMMNLCKQFESRTVEKEYRAVIAGFPQSTTNTTNFIKCKFFIRLTKVQLVSFRFLRYKYLFRSNSSTFDIEYPIGGKPAKTTLRILYTVPCNIYGNMTLVTLYPHTGRRHQLRRHCAAIGCPIIGIILSKRYLRYFNLIKIQKTRRLPRR